MAKRMNDEAMAVLEAALGHEHPTLADMHKTTAPGIADQTQEEALGVYQKALDEKTRALQVHQEALAFLLATFGPDHVAVANTSVCGVHRCASVRVTRISCAGQHWMSVVQPGQVP